MSTSDSKKSKKYRCDEENSNEAPVIKKKKKSNFSNDECLVKENNEETDNRVVLSKGCNQSDAKVETYVKKEKSSTKFNKNKEKGFKKQSDKVSESSKSEKISEGCKSDKNSEDCKSERKVKKQKKKEEKLVNSKKTDNKKSEENSSEKDQSKQEIKPYAGQWSEVNLGSGDRKDKFLRLLGGYKSSNIASKEKKKFSSFAFSKKKEENLNDNLEKQYETAWTITREKRGLGLGFDSCNADADKKPSFSWS